MPKYKVLKDSYLLPSTGPERVYKAGEVVEYDGRPGTNLELIEEPPKAERRNIHARDNTRDK